jgi:hypothetical protein
MVTSIVKDSPAPFLLLTNLEAKYAAFMREEACFSERMVVA